jgi:hypothetical protein
MENVIGMACSTYGGKKNTYRNVVGRQEGKTYKENLEVGGG